MTLIPTMGATFVVESFVTVVIGGANVLLGTAPAALLLAAIRMALNASYGQIIGQIGMLVAVILIIRVLPEGSVQRAGRVVDAERRRRCSSCSKVRRRSDAGAAFWSCFLVVLAGALIYPLFADSYDVGNFSYFLIWIFMALGPVPDVGLWRHAVVRPDAVLRHRRLRAMACWPSTWAAEPRRSLALVLSVRGRDDRGRHPRLFHDLGRHQRHLLRHRHAVGDAGAGVLPRPDRRARNGASATRG